MIKNYLKIAWRNISTLKFYTVLNISGLALAISCCMLIYLYTSYNLSFDGYHKQSKNIFRLVYELHLQKTEYAKGSSFREYTEVKKLPQVQQAAFAVDNQSIVVNVNGDVKKRFKEEGTVAFTDANWFKLFSFQWLAGNAAQLNQPGNAVLRQTTASKYFGNNNPIGQILTINNRQIKVVGVIADAPYNTDLRSNIYLSLTSLPIMPLYDKYFLTDWGYLNTKQSGFIVLNNANQKQAIERQLVQLETTQGWKDMARYYQFKLLPLNQVHFDTRYGGVVQKPLLLNLVIIGVLIIAIAIFNYINLTIAQQTKRAAEVATRKVLGGSAKQIFMQFIIESLLTSVLAVAAAVILVLLILPMANTWLFTDAPVYIVSYTHLYLFAGIVLLCITVGTGVYPALLLSRISIAQVLKNNVLSLPTGVGRKVMVVFQNTVTQGLIVCTIIIMLQVHFLKNTDIGFNRKAVITIPIGQVSTSQKQQFSDALKQIPAVQAFSICRKPPASDSQQGATIQYNGRQKWETWPARFAIGDDGYCATFGLHLIAGRNIRNNQQTPEFVINQTMAAMLEGKHPDAVLGKKLLAGDAKGIIVGVVKDFNVRSLAEPIEPSILLEDKNWQTNIAVKLSGSQTSITLGKLQKIYQHILPDEVFSYQFVDEQIARLYQKESIQQKLIWLAAVMAIVISSLGLLGMVSLIALQRTKEVGIRKILGATVTQISIMLSADFLWMVLIAFFIASPVAWWAMNKWLQNFAYRITISWWIFALAGVIAVFIAIVTVSFQSIKAAIANPVSSLRSE